MNHIDNIIGWLIVTYLVLGLLFGPLVLTFSTWVPRYSPNGSPLGGGWMHTYRGWIRWNYPKHVALWRQVKEWGEFVIAWPIALTVFGNREGWRGLGRAIKRWAPVTAAISMAFAPLVLTACVVVG